MLIICEIPWQDMYTYPTLTPETREIEKCPASVAVGAVLYKCQADKS